MGCIQSKPSHPRRPEMVSTRFHAEEKRKRDETPPPARPYANASSRKLLTPLTPPKKARSESLDELSNSSTPLPPPRFAPLTPPDSGLRDHCTRSDVLETEVPPTPTKAGRRSHEEEQRKAEHAIAALSVSGDVLALGDIDADVLLRPSTAVSRNEDAGEPALLERGLLSPASAALSRRDPALPEAENPNNIQENPFLVESELNSSDSVSSTCDGINDEPEEARLAQAEAKREAEPAVPHTPPSEDGAEESAQTEPPSFEQLIDTMRANNATLESIVEDTRQRFDGVFSSSTTQVALDTNASGGEYPLDVGPVRFRGRTIEELSDDERKTISDDDQLLKASPALRAALTEWACEWTFWYGLHQGKTLDEVPISYINRFVIGIGKHLQYPDIYVALKFHLPVRAPETPGEKYVLTFGRNKGRRLDGLPLSEYRPRTYIDWMKDEGIPFRPDWEDLAEGILYYHRQELAQFCLQYPYAQDYVFPHYPFRHYDCSSMKISDIPIEAKEEMKRIRDTGLPLQMDGDDQLYPGMREAVDYWFMLMDTNRWFWRTCVREEWGMLRHYPYYLGKNMFPSTELEGNVQLWLGDE